ncbi:hypothetical protein, partial [Sporisorium scitamineum]
MKGGGVADAPCFAKEASRKDICSALKQFGVDTQQAGCSDEECSEDAKDYSNHACNQKKQCDFGWDNSCDFYLHMGFSNVSKFGCGAAGSQQPQPGPQGFNPGWDLTEPKPKQPGPIGDTFVKDDQPECETDDDQDGEDSNPYGAGQNGDDKAAPYGDKPNGDAENSDSPYGDKPNGDAENSDSPY